MKYTLQNKALLLTVLLVVTLSFRGYSQYLPIAGGTMTGNLAMTSNTQVQTPYVSFNSPYPQPATSGNVAMFPNSNFGTLDIVGWGSGWRFIPNNGSTYPAPVVSIDNSGNTNIKGNLGIGTTTSPTLGLLQVNGTGDFLSLNSTTGTQVQLNAYNTSDFRIIQRSNSVMTLWTNTLERFRIDQNGNVGIGTTTPNDLLDVNGYSIFGPSVEKISIGSGSLGFNRKVATGAIYNNSKFAYQFQHTGSAIPGSDYLALQVYNPAGAGQNSTSLVINGSSQVGVNTSYIPAGYQFAVNGNAIATSITVQLRTAWPDYVFKKEYQLPTLADVKNYIDKNQHLPDMPSEAEVAKDGLNLGEMNKLLVKKVEELTLYLIEKDKKDKEQSKITEALEIRLKQQQEQIDELKAQMKYSLKH